MPLDLGRHLSAADNDGVHLTPEQHALLAELAAEKIRLMQGPAA
jgi:lysophospholipase L1-like esterase